MIKFRHFLFVAIISAFIYACGDDGGVPGITNFDHEGQAKKDHDSIVKFLSNHYFDVEADSIKPIDANQTPLLKDEKLKQETVKEYDIDYTYYYYVVKQGMPKVDKGFPKVTDSIFPVYKSSAFSKTDEITLVKEVKRPKWEDITNTIERGLSYGFTHFKGGNYIKNDNAPIKYENTGKGFFILPSGLAYRNTGANANKNFIFQVELYDFIENTDHDSDNVPSDKEDADKDGNVRNDDTDKDGIVNFLDNDDDGDGKLTKNEDANGDGDPTNDFSDTENPTLPDYLNPNIK